MGKRVMVAKQGITVTMGYYVGQWGIVWGTEDHCDQKRDKEDYGMGRLKVQLEHIAILMKHWNIVMRQRNLVKSKTIRKLPTVFAQDGTFLGLLGVVMGQQSILIGEQGIIIIGQETVVMIFGGTVKHYSESVGHCDMTGTTVIGIVSHGAGREDQRGIMIGEQGHHDCIWTVWHCMGQVSILMGQQYIIMMRQCSAVMEHRTTLTGQWDIFMFQGPLC